MTMRGAFRQAAEKQEQFTFNYEWEVSQLFKDRADLLDQIVFVSVGPTSAKQVGGSRALLAILDGKVQNRDGVIAPKGAEWQMLRRAVKARQAEYNRKGDMLFGLKNNPRAPANNNNRGPG